MLLIIMAKDKLKIPVPKIKLEPVIKVKDKTYNTDKFIDVVSNYLKDLIIMLITLRKELKNCIKNLKLILFYNNINVTKIL